MPRALLRGGSEGGRQPVAIDDRRIPERARGVVHREASEDEEPVAAGVLQGGHVGADRQRGWREAVVSDLVDRAHQRGHAFVVSLRQGDPLVAGVLIEREQLAGTGEVGQRLVERGDIGAEVGERLHARLLLCVADHRRPP